MMQPPRAATRDEVPVLDLAPLMAGEPTKELAQTLRHACETIGFFYVANHGVPTGTVDDLFAAMRRYFAQPLDKKMEYEIDKRYRRGYTPLAVNRAHEDYLPDLKESFGISLDLPLTDPDVMAGKAFHGPNRWPPDAPWFRSAAENYVDHVIRLSKRLLHLFALSLELPVDYFDGFTTKPMLRTSMFHYPPQPPVGPDNQAGVAPHTDNGMFTVLQQDPIGGLELQTRSGEWIGAPYIDDTFVINIGDLMQVWTNDVYISNLHRVINHSGRERYSVPTFFNLDYDTMVTCLPSCVSANRPAKYEPINFGDFFLNRFSRNKYKAPAEVTG